MKTLLVRYKDKSADGKQRIYSEVIYITKYTGLNNFSNRIVSVKELK